MKNEKWILKGHDYSFWQRESNRQEIIHLVSLFKQTKGKRFRSDGGFGYSVIFPNGIGEHIHLDLRYKTATRFLTS